MNEAGVVVPKLSKLVATNHFIEENGVDEKCWLIDDGRDGSKRWSFACHNFMLHNAHFVSSRARWPKPKSQSPRDS